ncbi:Chloroperoxidase [Mycena galericulata]|nr:Chloroperoxidase [Mycena galericulata]
MRFLHLVSGLLLVTHSSIAFPASHFDMPVRHFEKRASTLTNRTLVRFDPAQLIDVSNAHTFVPPGDGDFRGPCPGLNAMANHNYIPHNGIVEFTESIVQSQYVFGFGPDIGLVAAVLALFGADLLSIGFPFSIGGAPPPGLLSGILGGIVGPPKGLSGTHNQFESDTSPTRGDYYQFNKDNYDMQLPFFEALYNLQPDSPESNYDLPVLYEHRLTRFRQSIAENPYFFYFFNPEGFLNGEVLKTFHSINTNQDGTLTYIPGHERIPDNWYRRDFNDDYTILQHALIDLLNMWLTYPELLSIGGNVNGVNTYAPIDIQNLTGGVYNAEMLLDGNNAACFVFQAVQILVPDTLSILGELVDVIVNKLLEALSPILDGLTCPDLNSMDHSVFERYPGYARTRYSV